jgi:hypothetical protein
MNQTDTFQMKKYKWLTNHEEVFTIPSHQENKNQNYTGIPYYSRQNDYHQENNNKFW